MEEAGFFICGRSTIIARSNNNLAAFINLENKKRNIQYYY